ncbi:unnamed protein product [Mytilus edulis]|uniref:C1q domain-containing protein n=1 Tax=Mytilus edulis TaxID=6550 RepID=A0A8S3R8W7_MYTED|nr:unnamed protein product [Mytilus edulis]
METKYKRFVNYKVVLCLLRVVIRVNCFLIEPDNLVKPNANGTSQCLAVSQFLAEKKVLKHQIDEVEQKIYQLKHDNDQTLTILTEQLKHKLSIMEDKLSETSKHNDSIRLFDLERKYTLMSEILSKVQINYRDLQSRYKTQDLENWRLTNLTLELEKKITVLDNLEGVNQILDIFTLKQQVHSLRQTTRLLTNHQNARNQDFLDLYNLTITSEKNMKQLQKDFSYDLHMIGNNWNQRIYDVNSRITNTFKDISAKNNELQSIVNDQNVTIMDVYSEIANIKDLLIENSRKVALTACSNGGTFPDTIVKFPNILTKTGISDIVSFKSSGKFVCEFPGLYFISSNIRSTSNLVKYYLKKNESIISYSAITDWSSSVGITTTGISAAVYCQKNDELYLYLGSFRNNIDGTGSCFTVMKIK